MKAKDLIRVGTVQAKLQLFLYDLQNDYHLTFEETMLVLAECQRSTVIAELKSESERERRELRGSESRGQADGGRGPSS